MELIDKDAKDNHFKEECFADNPIDCCYGMILKLHGLKLS